MIQLTVNGKPRKADVDPDTPLLWALRDSLLLTGTKYSCGSGLCGACTVHVDGQPVRSRSEWLSVSMSLHQSSGILPSATG